VRERGPATGFIAAAVERGDELWSSQVIRVEVLAGMRSGEERGTYALLSLLRWADIGDDEAAGAGALGQRYSRSHPGIDTPDLLLAELAQRLGAELVTMNVKHFPMFPELKRPYSY
jgi:predicted nucleic acid-binding protein